MQRIGLFFNPHKEKTSKLGKTVYEKLSNDGYDVYVIDEDSADGELSVLECALCIGGDGSLIKLASLLNGFNVPVAGINAGNLGFLTCMKEDEVFDELGHILSGNYEVEKRNMLEAEVKKSDGSSQKVIVLNEIVVERNGTTRFLELDIFLNKKRVFSYGGDGVIVATPTGSTAYSMSAGGPLVYPDMKAFVITPLCAHSLRARPLVVPDSIEVGIEFKCEHEEDECAIVFDGHEKISIRNQDKITLRASDHAFNLIRSTHRSYGDIIHDKL